MKSSIMRFYNSMAGALKIGLVLDGGGLDIPDGVQQYILAIGEWFRGQGHDVRYLVGETRRTDIAGVHSLSRNIRVRFNGNRTTIPLPTSRSKLRIFLAAEQFDVLHIQTPYNPFMGEQLIMLAGPRTAIIGTFHILPNSRLISLGNRLLGLWSQRSLRRFDAMLSVSSAAADFARATFRINSVVLPNVIEYRRFHAAQPFRKYTDGTLTILFLGRLVPRKGCLLLLQALAKLAASGQKLPDFRVVICGKGPLEGRLQQFVTKQQLDALVTFTGFVTEADKPRYYASADIAVFPSGGGESFGIVLLEAMANGRTAVLAGDNPGYRSVMTPQPDLLFDAHDPAGLADKLACYLTDEALRQRMAQWGETYTKQFDTAIIGRKLLDIYQKALRKRRDS
jgi:phosphatidyl-myo-inositol alpha-mannosyltransferase